MSVGSLCRRPACTTKPQSTVREAAEQMERDRVGSLVVSEDGRPQGVVTDRDIALHALAGPHDAATTPVMAIATAPVVTLREELPLSQASDRMSSHGLRRVPVIDAAGQTVGMITADDIVRMIAHELLALADVAAEQVPAVAHPRVESGDAHRGVHHYAKEVVSASADEPVREAAQRMRAEDVGSVVVLDDDGAPVGIITDRDLTTRVVAKGLDPDATLISAVMTSAVAQVDAGDRLQDVARVMSEQGVRRVPVIHEGRVRGIVSYDDLLVALGRELHDLGEAARGAIARERR